MGTEAKENVKKREWVKNAAIIFLAVLLILTFFSNTILNRSLPEVATRSIGSGTIAARIRVTGTVAANQNYEVSIDESRKVRSVMVKSGQEVNTGDVLFVLSDGESEELEAAQDTLRQLQKSYQTALINASDSDYARENRDIRLAREALDDAIWEMERLGYRQDGADWARRAVEDARTGVLAADRELSSARTRVNETQRALLAAQAALDALGLQSPDERMAELSGAMEDAGSALTAAKNALEAATLVYGTQYDWVRDCAEQLIRQTAEYKARPEGDAREQYIEEKRAAYEQQVLELLTSGEPFPDGVPDGEAANRPTPAQASGYSRAYEEITGKQSDIAAAQAAYDTAAAEYERTRESYAEYYRRQEAVESAESDQRDADRLFTAAQEAQTAAEGNLQAVEAAVAQVKSAEKNLEDLLFSLQDQQKNDNRQAQLDSLDLQELTVQIERQQKRLDELGVNSSEKEVTAAVSGVIESVEITAGQTTIPGSAMATIQLPDMGYTLSASVPVEQARRVHAGDTASVANMYWGTQIDAVLTAVKTDPKDPQSSRMLTFDLSGDVTPGASLTLSVGQRSAEYDYVVPNSAIRSDSNGDFILVVEAKNSPLGDRYTATRVNVTKLANDDTGTAVSGALNDGDFVITTSTAPIKNGDRVRLADAQS